MMKTLTKLSDVNRELIRAGLPRITPEDKERLLKKTSREAIIEAVKNASQDERAKRYLLELFTSCGVVTDVVAKGGAPIELFALRPSPTENQSTTNTHAQGVCSQPESKYSNHRDAINQVIISDEQTILRVEALTRPIGGQAALAFKAAAKRSDGWGDWSQGIGIVLIGDALLTFAAVCLQVGCHEVALKDSLGTDCRLDVRPVSRRRVALAISTKSGSRLELQVGARMGFELNAVCVGLLRRQHWALKDLDVRILLENYIEEKYEEKDYKVQFRNSAV